MGREVEVVFFDVGGTLAWSAPTADVIWARALEKHGYRVTPEEVVRRTGVDGPEVNRPDLHRAVQAAWEDFQTLPFPPNLEEQEAHFRRLDAAILERLGLPVDEEVLDTLTRRFREDVESHLYEDALPTLERLQEADVRLGVISNATHDLPRGLETLGLTPFFEALTFSYEVGVEKPHPRIFRTALDRMGVEPARAVHVGDSYEADIQGARQVGLLPLLIRREGGGPDLDCVVLRSLEEVPDRLAGG